MHSYLILKHKKKSNVDEYDYFLFYMNFINTDLIVDTLQFFYINIYFVIYNNY